MTSLQSGDSPGTRIAAGDSVIEAAKSVDTAPIAKRLSSFKKIHDTYAKADGAVKKASAALQHRQALVGEADVEQDAAVIALAAALPADGLPRINPFKPLGAPSPTALCSLGYEAEAKAILALEAAALRREGLSKGSIAAAKAAGKAAKNVQSALAPIPALEKARTDAMSRRDALSQIWETAFAGLKRGARAAEDEGAQHLYSALFERKEGKATAARPRSKKAAKPAHKPA